VPSPQSNDPAHRACSACEQLLVAVLNNTTDLKIATEACWYRVPIPSAEKWLPRRWPPQWLAFYQTKVFGAEAFAINYYARIRKIRRATRQQLFPAEPPGPKSAKRYFQLLLDPLQKLRRPIRSKRWRRIVFIPTTWGKFVHAEEINDLYDESPLEDLLWSQLKRLSVPAERQEFITANGADYALDFALYCQKGKMDVETDGDTWHADPKRIPMDNRRDNDLETSGWKLLRFNSYQLREQMDDYCLPTIVKNLKGLGGSDESRVVPRDVQPDPSGASQMSLFDDQS
jgi:very-short-patch-repair endonuclease